ncbi:hypothetical protein B9Z19DRAFT_1095904 [Tuber borchii]|uniref:Uncharacterized protein n=1 Tax=Tuber borchii TaxID=42251 RepID=A0A2T6ZC36_TUBBO|nr:hypothetical protein B9Z19DRAFT_1095904 [Tuber borchii]
MVPTSTDRWGASGVPLSTRLACSAFSCSAASVFFSSSSCSSYSAILIYSGSSISLSAYSVALIHPGFSTLSSAVPIRFLFPAFSSNFGLGVYLCLLTLSGITSGSSSSAFLFLDLNSSA